MKRIFLIVFGILLLPLIAMQFSSEVNWNIFDFLMMGFLLTTTLFLIRYSKKYMCCCNVLNYMYPVSGRDFLK
mgnify:CR=1 FL=1